MPTMKGPGMTFEGTFRQWLESAMRDSIPDEVQAFAFNLDERCESETPFAVELIGSPEFDREDEDWACYEAWQSQPRSLPMPRAFTTGAWETCLENVKALVVASLHGTVFGDVLRSRRAVAVGFVSGDLDIVWQATEGAHPVS